MTYSSIPANDPSDKGISITPINQMDAKKIEIGSKVISTGRKTTRLEFKTAETDDKVYAIAVKSDTIYKTPPKLGSIEKINWAVLKVNENGKDGFVKVNRASLRKRLHINKKELDQAIKNDGNGTKLKKKIDSWMENGPESNIKKNQNLYEEGIKLLESEDHAEAFNAFLHCFKSIYIKPANNAHKTLAANQKTALDALNMAASCVGKLTNNEEIAKVSRHLSFAFLDYAIYAAETKQPEKALECLLASSNWIINAENKGLLYSDLRAKKKKSSRTKQIMHILRPENPNIHRDYIDLLIRDARAKSKMEDHGGAFKQYANAITEMLSHPSSLEESDYSSFTDSVRDTLFKATLMFAAFEHTKGVNKKTVNAFKEELAALKDSINWVLLRWRGF